MKNPIFGGLPTTIFCPFYLNRIVPENWNSHAQLNMDPEHEANFHKNYFHSRKSL